MIMVTHDIEEAIYLADKVVVMAGGHGGIGKIVPVPLPRPRHRSAAEFVRVREDLLRELHLSVH
jgi:sulfonate transport system ATP-binding protein